jgi:outer membrane protein OmpA-like peptidoglycan-associated protein
MTTKLNCLMVSLVALGLSGAQIGCAAHAEVAATTPAPAPPPPPPPAPPPPAPVAAAPAPPPPPAPPPAPKAVGKAKIEGSHVRIPGELEFDIDKATLKDTASTKEILNTLVEFLAQNPTVTKLRIEGHTDNTGAAEHNLKLSQERADAVAAWLSAHGVDKGRLVTKGFGSTVPLVANDTKDHKAMNRRTVFHIAELNGNAVPATAETGAAGATATEKTEKTDKAATPAPASK